VATPDVALQERLTAALDEDHDVVTATDEARLTEVIHNDVLDAVLVDATWAGSDAIGDCAQPVVALVDSTADQLPSGCVDVLSTTAPTAEVVARTALAVRVARADQDLRAARAELAEATRTDHLTGLANRRHVDEHLAMAASAARRHRQPMSLLLVDVDHLKRVNDAVGHGGGDAVIRTIATRLVHVLRGEDMAGRWGGDEFLVVAPSTDLDGAWRLGERIRDAVSASPVVIDGGRDVLVTVSIGSSTGPGDDLEAQLRQAESALDQARQTGRNRVVVTDATIMG
jgi:two-component system, cell cycle response regulator